VLSRLLQWAVVLAVAAWLSGCVTAPPGEVPSAQPPASTVSKTDPVDAPASSRFELMPPLQVPPLQVQDTPGDPQRELQRELQRGTASWYGPRFHGRRTASGERYNQQAFTAAHRTLPFGTLVRVRSLVNGREVEVRITDRGPYALGAEGRNRIIDVSRAAAVELDMMGLGVKEVALFVAESLAIDTPPRPPPKKRQSVRKQQGR
jgi:rare lipoprotein A